MQERWLLVAEIAAHLGVNPDTIFKWIERKQLSAHKVGRLLKFMSSEVDEGFAQGRRLRTTTCPAGNEGQREDPPPDEPFMKHITCFTIHHPPTSQ
jgi:excisionase family DNA binding protein